MWNEVVGYVCSDISSGTECAVYSKLIEMQVQRLIADSAGVLCSIQAFF
jgi:hypothetical protein